MAGVRVVVENSARVRASLERLGMVADKIVRFHLFKGGNDIANKARELVPFITGDLKRSITAVMIGGGGGSGRDAAGRFVGGMAAGGSDIGVEIGAGNTAVSYAEKVHEDFAMQQRRERRGGRGQWKFIEEPFNELQDDIVRDIENALDQAARSL